MAVFHAGYRARTRRKISGHVTRVKECEANFKIEEVPATASGNLLGIEYARLSAVAILLLALIGRR